MKEKKLITEYFDGVVRVERPKNSKTSPFVKSGLRLSLATAFSFLVLASVSSVGGTVSYFNDTEGVLNNYFKADPISFKVVTATDQIDLSEERKIDLVMTPDEVSDPIQYFVTSKVLAGNEKFCSGINIVSSEPFRLNTTIDSLNTDISTTTGTWTITTSVFSGLKVPGSSCQVELTYLGWRDGSALGKSFTDIRKVNLLFYIPSSYKAPEVMPVKEVIIQVPDISDTNVNVGVEEASSSETVDSKNTVIELKPSADPTVTPTHEVTVTPDPVVTEVPAEVPADEPAQTTESSQS